MVFINAGRELCSTFSIFNKKKRKGFYNYLAMVMNDTKLLFFLLQPDDRKTLSLGSSCVQKRLLVV